MAKEFATEPAALKAAERGAATIGAVAGVGALFSAAACCVLPLALAALGVGTGALSTFVPFHWPMTIAAAAAVTAGWVLHLQKRRACALDPSCAPSAPNQTTFVMLSLATLLVGLAALWPSYLERPLMGLLGGR